MTAICVPGSTAVKRQAEAKGLDRILIDAGFEWREAGCSMCFYAGGASIGQGERVITSTNRNSRAARDRKSAPTLPPPKPSLLRPSLAYRRPARVRIGPCSLFVTSPGGHSFHFDITEKPKEMLLHGLDAIALTLNSAAEIHVFRHADQAQRPWAYALE